MGESIRYQLVKMHITLESHDISNVTVVCMSTLSDHWHAQQPFQMGEALWCSIVIWDNISCYRFYLPDYLP